MRRNGYYIPPKLTKACNSYKVQSNKELNQLSLVLVKLTHSPSNVKAGAFPVWVLSVLVWSLAGLALLLVSAQVPVPVSSLHWVTSSR